MSNESKHPVAEGWRHEPELRRIRRLSWLLPVPFFSAFAATVIADMVGEWLKIDLSWMRFSLVMLGGIAAFWCIGAYVGAKCPRCGKRFFTRERYMLGNPFAGKCMNCELPLRPRQPTREEDNRGGHCG